MPSLRKAAYTRFMDALRNKELVLGGNYTQAELCRQLDLSTNPLQAALKVLESEGFVEIRARAGVTVKRPDLTEFRECQQFRQLLEMGAIQQFAGTHSLEDLAALRAEVVAQRERTETRASSADLAKAHDAIERWLHGGIIQSLNNATIMRIYKTNMNKVAMMRRESTKLTNEHFAATSDEHLEIIDAALDRDVAGAAKALQQHLTASLQRAIITNLYTTEF
ncbi:GntR family transcriptional regulator [Oceaniglobus trochenteri]|uniref:GntR family transcriptional regulator n=1 Tax=Oceaniglobus trochenteri TaxID=2763260 RepID=UPI001CFFDF76|nr:GntR family transcriptional regulator [Oceaniglobus trochenteri]